MPDYINDKRKKFKLITKSSNRPSKLTEESRVCLNAFRSSILYKGGMDGKFHLHSCCLDWISEKNNELISDPEDIIPAYNAPTMQKVRRGILDESYSGCDASACPFLISHRNGTKQFAKISNIQDVELRTKILKGDLDGYTPQSFADSSINTCNLYCQSCRSKPIKDPKDHTYLSGELFKYFSKEVEELHFLGSGEFMTVPHLANFVKKFKKEDYPKLSYLYILSNGTMLTKSGQDSFSKDFWDMPKDIRISIDAGTEEVYSKVRLGGDFKILHENLKHLSKRIGESPSSNLHMSFVIQKYNYKDMCNFITLAHSLNATRVNIERIQDWWKEGEDNYYSEATVANKGDTLYEDFLIEKSKARQLADKLGIESLFNS